MPRLIYLLFLFWFTFWGNYHLRSYLTLRQLDKPITIGYEETKLDAVLRDLTERSDLTVVVDWNSLAVREHVIELRVSEIPLSTVLDLISLQLMHEFAGVEIRGGRVVIVGGW